jgi:hypothetical protein
VIDGDVEVDVSTLTGGSLPAERWGDAVDHAASLVEAPIFALGQAR